MIMYDLPSNPVKQESSIMRPRLFFIIYNTISFLLGLRLSTRARRQAEERRQHLSDTFTKAFTSKEAFYKRRITELEEDVNTKRTIIRRLEEELDSTRLRALFSDNLSRSREVAVLQLLKTQPNNSKRKAIGSFEVAIKNLRLWHDMPFEQTISQAMKKEDSHAV